MTSDEQIDISILKNDLLSTEDHVKTLTDQVDNLLANSDRYATDAQNIVSKAGGTSEVRTWVDRLGIFSISVSGGTKYT